MIDQLSGVVGEKSPTKVYLQCGPLRLELAVPLTTSQRLPDPGGPVLLWTHLLWREDGPTLFGFCTRAERELFRLLILVQGVGPRIALSLLSHLPPLELIRQIRARSIEGLTHIPGIGPKTAGRILVDLGPRVDRLEPAAAWGEGDTEVSSGAAAEDAVQALTALGYPLRDARKAIERVQREDGSLSLDEAIRRALQTLTAGTRPGG
jgi:holliday junction DNA helicase RuvA